MTVLELRVNQLQQLFDSMDPAPFRDRDIDAKARDYIVEWAREQQAGRPIALIVHVDNPVGAEDAPMVQEAFGEYFRQRSLATSRQLRRLLRIGRISLIVGLAFLSVAFFTGEVIAGLLSKARYSTLVQESLVIGGWVALWRPLEIFLYDWWPIRGEARLYERLSKMQVSLVSSLNHSI